MGKPVIDIFRDDGSVSRYKRLSARLPAFLEAYPPQAGYRIEAEMTDSLSLQKGRLALLREAIAAGKSPEALGLPAVGEASVMVCTRRLVGPDGHVLASASAAKPILAYKDLEIVETAALQRLLATLGFGGEVFDADEDADMAHQGLRTDSAPAAVTPLSERAEAAPSGAGSSQTETPSGETPPATPSEGCAGTSPSADVPLAMVRQVESLARRLGEPVPGMRSLAEAKSALKDLSAKVRARRAEAG